MNETIKKAISSGDLILFLGAGASRGCIDKNGLEVLDGNSLAERLAAEASIDYDGEPLGTAYSAARHTLQARLDPILEELFRHIRPSDEYQKLAQYPWRRIYTLNIDDGLETALYRSRKQDIEIFIGSDAVKNQDQFFQRLDYIKLNGSITRLADGVIFSPAEYGRATHLPHPWYEESAIDYLRSTFVFIGTKLNEPLLKYHVERLKILRSQVPGRSFVITPKASEIEKLDLATNGITHLPGTLKDFTDWLVSNFPTPPTSTELATRSNPALKRLIEATSPTDNQELTDLFDGLTLVKRDLITFGKKPITESGSIRDFYKGFEPSWEDILDNVPANLHFSAELTTAIADKSTWKNTVLPILGPAGSGKTTLLMQTALWVSDNTKHQVYFMRQPVASFLKTLEACSHGSNSDETIFFFIDNADLFADELANALSSKRYNNFRFVVAERENIWNRRASHKLHIYINSPYYVRDFDEEDAKRILKCLEIYGSWTRLSQLKPKARLKELTIRAKRQLLIALMEATSGRGYERIIEDDYASLKSDDERLVLIVVGLISIHKVEAPIELLSRTFAELNLLAKLPGLLPGLSGIVIRENNSFRIRHPLYMRHLIDQVVDPTLTDRAVKGLMRAFSKYPSPVMKNIPKRESPIWKGIINHRFLGDVLRGKTDLILGVYKSFEKRFENDGLFWLQYGLALRDATLHTDALEKFQLAHQAYPMEHTTHALAQELLITAEALPRAAAFARLEEARKLLRKIDSIIDSDDTFPIVTLAEGHVKLVRKFDGNSTAQLIAKGYANELHDRSKDNPGETRLAEAWHRMTRFATTGKWKPANGN